MNLLQERDPVVYIATFVIFYVIVSISRSQGAM